MEGETNNLSAHERALAAQPVQVPGQVLADVLIPNRGYLRARRLRRGESLRLIDCEGRQVPDVILFDPRDLRNCSSCMNTKVACGRWRIGLGDTIHSKDCDRLATITADTVGCHLFDGGFCSAETNALRYGIEGSHSCRANLAAAMARHGLTQSDLELDSCFSLFMNAPPRADGSFAIAEPMSRAGDHIDLRAEMDLLVAVSNCPQERNPCNGWRPTALRAILFR